ncbi:MAG: 2'-5' RNA ligase family protein [Blastocatellia bacterium]
MDPQERSLTEQADELESSQGPRIKPGVKAAKPTRLLDQADNVEYTDRLNRVNERFAKQYGRPITVSGLDTPMHRKGNRENFTSDIRTSDLTPEHRKFVQRLGDEEGIKFDDYTDTWKQHGFTGPHMHGQMVENYQATSPSGVQTDWSAPAVSGGRPLSERVRDGHLDLSTSEGAGIPSNAASTRSGLIPAAAAMPLTERISNKWTAKPQTVAPLSTPRVKRIQQPPDETAQRLANEFEQLKASGNIAEANRIGLQLQERGWEFGSKRDSEGKEWPYVKPRQDGMRPLGQHESAHPSAGTGAYVDKLNAEKEQRRRQEEFRRNDQRGVVRRLAEGASRGARETLDYMGAGAGRLIEDVSNIPSRIKSGVKNLTTSQAEQDRLAAQVPSTIGPNRGIGGQMEDYYKGRAEEAQEAQELRGRDTASQIGHGIGQTAPYLLLGAAGGRGAVARVGNLGEVTGGELAFGSGSTLASQGEGKPLAESVLTGAVGVLGLKGGGELAETLAARARNPFTRFVANTAGTAAGLATVRAGTGGGVADSPEAVAHELAMAIGFSLIGKGWKAKPEARERLNQIANDPETHPEVKAELEKISGAAEPVDIAQSLASSTDRPTRLTEQAIERQSKGAPASKATVISEDNVGNQTREEVEVVGHADKEFIKVKNAEGITSYVNRNDLELPQLSTAEAAIVPLTEREAASPVDMAAHKAATSPINTLVESKHKFSSTQTNLPDHAAEAVKQLGSKIPDADLAADGRESQPHITVKYGLHGNDAEAVRRVVESEPPIKARLGKTSVFEGVEDGKADAVAVKVDVDSPDLHRLNKKIADALPHTDTYPDYKPHVTLAYTKPGLGKKYSGDASLEGREITLDKIAFSDRDGNQHEIQLKGGPDAESSLVGLSAADRVVAQPEAPRLHHERFGEVERAVDQSGVARGYLRVTDAEGNSHVIQNPRVAGNREAAFIKSREIESAVTKPEAADISTVRLTDQADALERELESGIAPVEAVTQGPTTTDYHSRLDRYHTAATKPISKLTKEEFAGLAKGEYYSEALSKRPRPSSDDVVAKVKDIGKAQQDVRKELLDKYAPGRSLYESDWQNLNADKYYDEMQAAMPKSSETGVDGLLKGYEGPIKPTAEAARPRINADDSLTTAIVKLGGIDQRTQEGRDIAKYLAGREGGRPGALNRKGLPADEMIAALQGEGWDFETPSELLEAIRREQGGSRQHSSAFDAVEAGQRETESQMLEQDVASGTGPQRRLPQTMEAAKLESGIGRSYEPETISYGIDRGREIVGEKGVDGAIEHVLHGQAGIEWASTGYAAMEGLRKQEADLRTTDPTAADAIAAKRLKFVGDFAEEATKRGQAIAGIRAIEEFAPDRAAYEANRLSVKKRKRSLSREEDARITQIGEELQIANDRIKRLESQLEKSKARASKQAAKPKAKSSYQSNLEESALTAKAALAVKLGKLEFGSLSRPGERGAVKINEAPLEGDAELLAQYAASRLNKAKTVADLNAELVKEFGPEVEPHLPAVRRRAYAIRQEARLAEMATSEPNRQRTILRDIQREITDGLTQQREAESRSQRATRADRRADRKQQHFEAEKLSSVRRIQEGLKLDAEKEAERERLNIARRQYREAADAQKKAYRADVKSQRAAERQARIWDTPLRDEAAAAKTRLGSADPKSPETLNDLVSVATEMLLPEQGKNLPRVRPVNPSQFYVDLKTAYPELVTKKNQGQIYRRAFQRLQDSVTASREAARLASASAESKSLWEKLGLDTEAQALMIQRAEAQREQIQKRAKMIAEFNRVGRSKARHVVDEIQSLPRALQSSIDAPVGRQGLFYSVIRPVESAKVMLPATWRGYTSFRHASFDRFNQEVQQHPDYGLAVRSGLDLAKMASEADPRVAAEEGFQSTFAERLPHVRLSEQGYNAGMNAQRLTMFSRYADYGRSAGYTPESNPEFFREAARRVNIFTGRGSLSQKTQALTSSANWLLYSARLQVSRFQMLTDMLNPVNYTKWSGDDPAIRRIRANEAIRTAAAMSLLYGTAKAIGLKVTADPDDADFGKVTVGNTHYDLTGGNAGLVRLVTRLVKFAGQMATGDENEKQTARDKTKDVAGSFARQKLAPWPQFFWSGLTGTDAVGKPTTWGKLSQQMVQPMIVGDIVEAASQDGWLGVVKAAPGLAGFGVQNYETKPPLSADEKLVHGAYSDTLPRGEQSPAQRDRSKSMSEIEASIRKGDKSAATKISEAIKAGIITEDDIWNVADRLESEKIEREFKTLPIEKALDVYERLSPEGKKKTQADLADKIFDIDKLPVVQQKALSERIKRIFTSQ